MANIILLDDEKHCTDILETLITKVNKDYNIIGVFNNPFDALDFIKNHEIDLFFLDIEMPEMNGFKLLDKILPVNFDIIFTTAYDQYALRAFEYSAINYLLKPITEKAIIKTLLSWERRKRKVASEQWQMLQSVLSNSDVDINKIALPSGVGFEIIEIKSIVRCQSENNYTTFFLADGSKKLISRTLKEVEATLSEHSFFRVHQSHLINSRYVKMISKQEGGTLLMEDGVEVPISRQKRSHINEILDSMLHFE